MIHSLSSNLQIVADMDELEQRRKQEFKNYAMKKKAEEDHRMVC